MKIRIAETEDAQASLAFLEKFREEKMNTVLKHDDVQDLDDQRKFIANLDGGKPNGVRLCIYRLTERGRDIEDKLCHAMNSIS